MPGGECFLFMINGLFGDFSVKKAMFEQNIEQFEEDMKKNSELLQLIMELLMIMMKMHYH